MHTVTDSGTTRQRNGWEFSEPGGWTITDPDRLAWSQDHVLRCSGVTAPGDRCRNRISVGARGWLITPIEATPIVFCHSHIEQARIAVAYREVTS